MNALAELLVIDRTTLSRNLRPLTDKGSVTINPGSDQRMRVVALSAEGRVALEQALPLWEQVQAEIVEQLGAPRFTVLLETLGASVMMATGEVLA